MSVLCSTPWNLNQAMILDQFELSSVLEFLAISTLPSRKTHRLIMEYSE